MLTACLDFEIIELKQQFCGNAHTHTHTHTTHTHTIHYMNTNIYPLPTRARVITAEVSLHYKIRSP